HTRFSRDWSSDVCSSDLYVSRLGVSFSKYAFLTAKPMDAATLLRIGYLQEVVPADAFEDRVRELAAQIATLAPFALESLKLSLKIGRASCRESGECRAVG